MNNELRIKECSQKRRLFSRLFHTTYYFLPATSRRGFTVLFAVLIGSLLFSLGLAIAHLTLKEIILSAAGKQSETAFYAADTGIECALYWDLRMGKSQTVFPNSDDETGRATIACNGVSNVPVYLDDESNTSATSTFRLSFTPAGCADVVVGKVAPQAPKPARTIIESRGRNDCGTGINPARVERALRVRY